MITGSQMTTSPKSHTPCSLGRTENVRKHGIQNGVHP